jgi:hypothetical protein
MGRDRRRSEPVTGPGRHQRSAVEGPIGRCLSFALIRPTATSPGGRRTKCRGSLGEFSFVEAFFRSVYLEASAC